MPLNIFERNTVNSTQKLSVAHTTITDAEHGWVLDSQGFWYRLYEGACPSDDGSGIIMSKNFSNILVSSVQTFGDDYDMEYQLFKREFTTEINSSRLTAITPLITHSFLRDDGNFGDSKVLFTNNADAALSLEIDMSTATGTGQEAYTPFSSSSFNITRPLNQHYSVVPTNGIFGLDSFNNTAADIIVDTVLYIRYKPLVVFPKTLEFNSIGLPNI